MSDDFALDFIHSLENKNNISSSSPELEKYLSLLNPEQKEAVEHSGSPLLILAGAGSGKTRVITTKIAYLINQKGIEPYQILAVTFTKKAAKEMQDRAVAMESRSSGAMIRTFHSFGAWFLRKYYQEAGVDQSFTVYDDDDMVTLLNKAVPSLNKQQASAVAHNIALAKDYCLTPDDPGLSQISAKSEFREAYKAYETRLRQTGNVDFGDLIMLPALLLENNENIRRQMHYRFKVIMVDEYQDSNVAQFKLLRALAGDVTAPDPTYVCVVGDDDQSIYKFRGAEVQNILSFQEEFEGTQLIRLERNYRSTSKILFAADKIVSKNEDRLGKTLIAERGEGKKPVLVFLPNQDEEAKFCASMILQSNKKGCPFNDWAILYRTNAQSLTFESEFLRQKIPYQVVGSLKFYEREEIKDMLAVLSLCANPRDEISFRRIINKPSRGIGGVTQDKILSQALTDQGFQNLIETCKTASESMTKKAKEGVLQFTSFMDELFENLRIHSTQSEQKDKAENKDNKKSVKQTLAEFVEIIMNKSGLLELHKAQDEIAGTQKANNMQELVNSAVLYEYSRKGLLEFLDHIELDRTLENESEVNSDCVTLITLHNTKGLEFPRVVITGLESGIFPRQDKSGADLEEERRLFYVGITRAKDELYITSCHQRRLYGRSEFMEPSPFLFEAGDKPFRVLGEKPLSYQYQVEGKEEITGGFESEADENKSKWSVGTRIYHDDYGYGQIVRSTIEEGELVISVLFENGGTKRFLPEFQKSSLTIIKD
ncbi:MAG: ATP-dependent helicase [Treponema sp.]|uniref:ATP-dependent helicase n=1 Tax=Treponema sp. TaxID=166 RepID=UPI00298DA99E|nr:UvrD-helicase domain-containing protein [Treponema sp.]MCQ2601028.1 ATP-dependent helicase [Treponema sp.]